MRGALQTNSGPLVEKKAVKQDGSPQCCILFTKIHIEKCRPLNLYILFKHGIRFDRLRKKAFVKFLSIWCESLRNIIRQLERPAEKLLWKFSNWGWLKINLVVRATAWCFTEFGQRPCARHMWRTAKVSMMLTNSKYLIAPWECSLRSCKQNNRCDWPILFWILKECALRHYYSLKIWSSTVQRSSGGTFICVGP